MTTDAQGPGLLLPFSVQTKLGLYARSIDKEISGLGEIVFDKAQNMLRVEQLHLVPQKCSAADTELTPAGLQAFLAGFLQGNGNPEHLRFHWHSHVKMGVFWSAQDDSFCRGWDAPWFAALVTNHKGEYLARLEVREPFVMTIPMQVYVEQYYDSGMEAAVIAEIATKVEAEIPRVWTGLRPAWKSKEEFETVTAFETEANEKVKDFIEKQGRFPNKSERKELRKNLRKWSSTTTKQSPQAVDEWIEAMDSEFRGGGNPSNADYCGV